MYKKEVNDIKNSISMCQMRLQAIMPYLGDNKPLLNENFNKLLIEKAILRDKLIKKKTPLFVKLAEKIIPNNKKELICDYFK